MENLIKKTETFYYLYGVPVRSRFEYKTNDGLIEYAVDLYTNQDKYLIKIKGDSVIDCVDKLMREPMYQHMLINIEYLFVSSKRTLIKIDNTLGFFIYNNKNDQPQKKELTIDNFNTYRSIEYLLPITDRPNKDNKNIILCKDVDFVEHEEIFKLIESHENYQMISEQAKEKEDVFINERKKEQEKRIENIHKTNVQFMKNYIKKYPKEAIEFVSELNQDEIGD